MYLLLEIGKNILAQVSMQKNLEEKRYMELFQSPFEFCKKLAHPKNRFMWWSKTNFIIFSQFSKTILCFPKWLETTKKQLLTLI